MTLGPHGIANHRPVPKGPAGYCLIGICVLIAVLPAASRATEPELLIGPPVFDSDMLDFSLTIRGLLAGDIREALEADLPATLLLEWRLWQERGRLWDTKVDRGAAVYRIRFDVLSNRFSLFDARGRHLHSAADPGEIEQALSSGMKISLNSRDVLHRGREYYIEAMVRVETLAEKDIAGLESWLRGDGADSSRSLLSGLSRKATGWLKDIAGPDSRSAWVRSKPFRAQ